jgi:hypothetical protein
MTTTEKQHAWLLKRFHTQCTRLGIEVDQKKMIVAGFGYESSKDMSNEELQQACTIIERQLNPELVEMDKWRKRALAAIGGWLRTMSIEENPDKVKGIACKATQYSQFNEIPKDRLVNVYYSFLKKQKDWKRTEDIVKDELDTLTVYN